MWPRFKAFFVDPDSFSSAVRWLVLTGNVTLGAIASSVLLGQLVLPWNWAPQAAFIVNLLLVAHGGKPPALPKRIKPLRPGPQ